MTQILSDEEIKTIYLKAPTAKEAAKLLGLSKYQMAMTQTRLGLPKKVYQLQGGKRPRHWGHSIYDSVITSQRGEIKHHV
jgi:hypothetical protein